MTAPASFNTATWHVTAPACPPPTQFASKPTVAVPLPGTPGSSWPLVTWTFVRSYRYGVPVSSRSPHLPSIEVAGDDASTLTGKECGALREATMSSYRPTSRPFWSRATKEQL